MPPSPAISNHLKEFDLALKFAPPGPIAEFGCYEGGSARILSQYNRPVFAFDTYEGIPAEDFTPGIDDDNRPGKFKPLYTMQEMFGDYPNIFPVKGRFMDTLPMFSTFKWSFAYIDCDLYESYIQVLNYISPRLLGNTMICDDYQCPGARKAINEFLSYHPEWTFFPERQLFIKQ